MMESEERARKIARRVAINNAIVEKSDAYLSKAEPIAEAMVQARLNNAQIKGLQTLSYTTDKASDVVDWIKIRVGRESKWTRIGSRLLGILHQELKQDAGKIVDGLPTQSNLPADMQRQIHLRLIREYLTHVSAHFEYIKSVRTNS